MALFCGGIFGSSASGTSPSAVITSAGSRMGSKRLDGVSIRTRSFPFLRESSTFSRPLLQVNAVCVMPPSWTRMRFTSSASTWKAASVAWPQKATSEAGVNQRRWSAAVGSRAGSGNAVSLCFSSPAMRCIALASSSAPSSTTPAELPASGCALKASTT